MTSKPFNPFREALKHLETCESEHIDRGEHKLDHDCESFVCWAIRAAGHNQGNVSREDHARNVALCKAAIKYITDALTAKHSTVTSWLYENSCEYRAVRRPFGGYHPVMKELEQAYRWRWTNQMADDFDAGLITSINEYMKQWDESQMEDSD